MRKELAEREKLRESGGERDLRTEQATEHFDKGFSLLMEAEVERALPFLARAAHFAPKVARFRAYYGKALSADEKQQHKAEGEIQAALRIEPDNATFRIMLAEFFIQNNLLKRAEGELTRLLAKYPTNREARELLETLKK
jgi:predicted Zn-dependent protease